MKQSLQVASSMQYRRDGTKALILFFDNFSMHNFEPCNQHCVAPRTFTYKAYKEWLAAM